MKKRWLLISLAILVVLISAVLIGGPYYAKSYIEKNSEELIGRKITMSRLHFNTLNGHLLITDFKLFEQNKTDQFVGFDTLYANFALYKLLGGHLFSDAFHLIGPDIHIFREDEIFNFADLIPPADTINTDSAQVKKESFLSQFTVNDIQILKGQLLFTNHAQNIDHLMKNINILLPGISIGDKETNAGLEFEFADGGSFAIKAQYDLEKQDLHAEIGIKNFNLNQILPYAKPRANIHDLNGFISADLVIDGNANHPDIPVVSGIVNMTHFSLVDVQNTEVLAFSDFLIQAEKLDLATNNFHFKSVEISQPTVHPILTSEGDNFSAIFKKNATNDTVQVAADTTKHAPLNYLVDEFRVRNGRLIFEDKSLAEGEFKYTVSQLEVAANNVTEGQFVTIESSATLNEKGSFLATVSTDFSHPENGGTFNFKIENTNLADFSPYVLNSTAFPMTGGRMTFQTENEIKDQHLNSHFLMRLYKTELGEKRKDIKTDVNVPLKLGLAVLQDTKGRINIDVPAEGDVNDPEFKYTKLIWKVVLNVLVKAAASPYNLLAGAVGANEDDIKFIRTELLQTELAPEQTTQLDLIADILTQKPEISATATLELDIPREAETVREFIAKRDFYLNKKQGDEAEIPSFSMVEKAKIMAIEDDKKLVKFLVKNTENTHEEMTLDELIHAYVSNEMVTTEHTRIKQKRLRLVKEYMAQKNLGDRFIVADEWVENPARNRPRFEMTYSVAEQ